MSTMINNIKAQLLALDTEIGAIRAAVEKEQRLMTSEEEVKMEKAQSDYATLTKQLKLLDSGAQVQAALAEPRPVTRPALSITQTSKAYNHMGAFLMDVRAARSNQGAHERLMNAATTYGVEGTDADGGYAVPDDLRRDIQSFVYGQSSLLPLVDQIPTFSNTITFPIDTVQPWSVNYSGSWLAEGGAYNEAKPSLGTLSVSVGKVGTIINVTDELMADAAAMGAFISRKAGERLTQLLNAQIISGSGANNSPNGILLSPAKKVIAKETGQLTNTLVAQNVQKMFFGMQAADRVNAVWLVSDSAEPYLANLQLSGSSPVVYNRPGDYVNGPNTSTLMGRPVIVTPNLSAFSAEGDIVFFNPKKYLAVVKGGVNAQTTPYFYWNQDIQSFKVNLRVGGKTWEQAVTTLPDTTTRSPYVVLGAR